MNFNRTDLIWMTSGFQLCVEIQACKRVITVQNQSRAAADKRRDK